MNVRLQTHNETTDKTLRKALGRIIKMSDILSNKFENALIEYDKN